MTTVTCLWLLGAPESFFRKSACLTHERNIKQRSLVQHTADFAHTHAHSLPSYHRQKIYQTILNDKQSNSSNQNHHPVIHSLPPTQKRKGRVLATNTFSDFFSELSLAAQYLCIFCLLLYECVSIAVVNVYVSMYGWLDVFILKLKW